MSVFAENQMPPHALKEKLRLERLLGELCVHTLGRSRNFVLIFQVIEDENHTGCVSTMEPADMKRFMKQIADDILELAEYDTRKLIIGVDPDTKH